jgi:hypothetical protein
MEKLLQDIRYGARSILKAPRFTVAAVLTLALGIGATAMFSVIRSVLMRSWPFPHPVRLLLVSQRQGVYSIWPYNRLSGNLGSYGSISATMENR